MTIPPPHSLAVFSTNHAVDRNAVLGVVFVVCAAMLYSLGSVLTKTLLLHFSVAEMALARTTVTCTVLFALAVIYYRKHLRVAPRDLPLAFAYGVIAMVLSPFMFFSAIERMPVGVVLIISYSAPILIVLWLRLVRGVRIARSALAGMVICLFGLAFVAFPAEGLALDGVGVAYAIGGAVTMAAFFLLAEKQLQRRPAAVVSFLGYAVGSACWLLLVPAWRFPFDLLQQEMAMPAPLRLPELPAFYLIPAIAVLCTVTPGIMWLRGVQLLGPARASALSMIEPVFSAAIAWMLLAEALSPLQIAGGSIALMGLLYLEGPWRRPASNNKILVT